MKNSLIAILPLIFLSCSGYTISGEVAEGTSAVVLSKLVGKNPVPVDTVQVDDCGGFRFTGHADTPFMAYISDAASGDVLTDLCVANTDIYLSYGESGYEYVGGVENARYKSIRSSLFDQELTVEQMYAVMDSAIMEDPSCTAYSYVLFRNLYLYLPLEQSEKLESRFSEDIRSNSYLTILRELIAQTRKSMPGNQILDFASLTPSGDTISLSSLKGSWVLLDFWASWCPYCRLENPQLVELYSKYHPKGLEILSVSLDNERDAWIKAIEADSMTWLNVSDLDKWECKPARMYGISAIPGNVLISPDGIISARQLHQDNLEMTLDSILKQ